VNEQGGAERRRHLQRAKPALLQLARSASAPASGR
jgi:hypothetical protein